MTVVVAYAPDLMDRSKISAAASAVDGVDLRYVGSPEALVGLAGVDLVILDLAKRGALDVIADVVASGVRVTAFGSHVDVDTLEAARAAGCDDVLPRSRFFASLPAVLRG